MRRGKKEERKEGRRNTHSVGEHHRFYVTQTSPYIARTLLLLTAHQIATHCQEITERREEEKKWRWRWNRKRRREKSIVSLHKDVFITRFNPFTRVARRFRKPSYHLFAIRNVYQDAIRKKIERRDNKFYAEFLTINVKRLIEFLAKFDEL